MRQLSSGAAVFRTGPDGRIVDWNPAAERLTGIRASEAEGRPCWEVLAGRDGEGGILCHSACSVLRLARDGWPVGCLELTARTPQGANRLTLTTIVLRDDEGPEIVHVMQKPAGPAASEPKDTGEPDLTPRQREILLLLSRGVRARQIAASLTLSETTVRNHIQAILLALGVHSQLEAVALVHALGADEQPAA